MNIKDTFLYVQRIGFRKWGVFQVYIAEDNTTTVNLRQPCKSEKEAQKFLDAVASYRRAK